MLHVVIYVCFHAALSICSTLSSLCRLCDDSCSDWCESSHNENYLIVILICVSLVISDVEHLFICPLPVCVLSMEKCLFRSSAYLFGGDFFSLILSLSLIFVPTAHLLVHKPMYKVDFQSAGIKLLYHKVSATLLRVCNHLFL